MCCECMHAVASWRCSPPQYDRILVNTNELELGLCKLSITCARLFFSTTVNCIKYPCMLVHWYSQLRDSPDKSTGMWVVEPDVLEDGTLQASVIHLDTVVYLAHLLPIYGDEPAPRGMKYTDSLDIFSEYYINKFADHNAFEIAF